VLQAATSPTLPMRQRDAVERTSALGFALRRKSSPAGWTYVGPFCRKGLCSLLQPATSPTLPMRQRDTVEWTSALVIRLAAKLCESIDGQANSSIIQIQQARLDLLNEVAQSAASLTGRHGNSR